MNRLTDLLRARPLVLAPMAGGVGTPELVTAVDEAGGVGFLAAGYLSPERVQEQVADVRAAGVETFGVNLFVPGPPGDAEAVAAYRRELGAGAGEARHDDDAWHDKIALVERLAVPVVSFTFGCPEPDVLRRVQAVGAATVVSVTTVAEARQAVARGADGVSAQGREAGGHRASFDPAGGPDLPTLELVAALADTVDVPIIAAGGLMDGAAIAAVLERGATAAQLGTVFLRCPESGANPAHKEALADPRFPETALTRAFTGRPARGLVNRFMREHPKAPVAYPEVHHLTRPLRAAAARTGDPEGMSLWAGEGFARATTDPARDVVARLRAEAAAAGARI